MSKTKRRVLSIAMAVLLLCVSLPTLVGASAITITKQPEAFKGYKGYTATFSVEATGSRLSYQWQMRAKAGEAYQNIKGATDAEYETPTLLLSHSNRRYRVIVKDGDGHSRTSADVNLVVRDAALRITKQPRAQRVYEDEAAIFTVAAEGPGKLSYQWQQRLPGETAYEAIDGANDKYYTVDGLTTEDSGSRFRVIVSSDVTGVKDVISDSANLMVKAGERPSNDPRPPQDLEDLEDAGQYQPEITEEPTATPKPTTAPTSTPKPTEKPTAAPTATPEPADLPDISEITVDRGAIRLSAEINTDNTITYTYTDKSIKQSQYISDAPFRFRIAVGALGDNYITHASYEAWADDAANKNFVDLEEMEMRDDILFYEPVHPTVDGDGFRVTWTGVPWEGRTLDEIEEFVINVSLEKESGYIYTEYINLEKSEVLK